MSSFREPYVRKLRSELETKLALHSAHSRDEVDIDAWSQDIIMAELSGCNAINQDISCAGPAAGGAVVCGGVLAEKVQGERTTIDVSRWCARR